MAAAYDDLPADVKRRIEDLTATHDFNKFWDEMLKRPGTQRKPLTRGAAGAEAAGLASDRAGAPDLGPQIALLQRRLCHQIDGLPKAESDELLAFMFAASGAAEIQVRAQLDRGRRACLGQSLDDAQRAPRLSPRRAAPDAPLPSDGRLGAACPRSAAGDVGGMGCQRSGQPARCHAQRDGGSRETVPARDRSGDIAAMRRRGHSTRRGETGL